MKNIRTITLNPVFDLHYRVPDFRAGVENLVVSATREAGGKGVNTSRALAANGVDNLAYVVLGCENGGEFADCLKRDGVPCRCFPAEGRIREGITVHPDAGPETRLAVNTFRLPESTFSRLEQTLLAEDLPTLLVSFSGRIPTGFDKERVLTLLQRLRDGGAAVVADSASFTAEDLRRLHPWFIKPNAQETLTLWGRAPETPEDAVACAQGMAASGVSENVLLSLGGDGAAYAGSDGAYLLRVPPLTAPVSTIGAGDSVVAGLLAGAAQGLPMEACLRLAMAYGTAACMTPGTRPPRPEDVAAVLPRVLIEKTTG